MNPRKLALGTFLLMTVNIVKSGAMFLMLPVMAKLVGPAEYGIYSLALPAVMFVMVIVDGGLGLSLARERDDFSAVWSSAFLALIVSAFVLMGFLAIYSWVISPTPISDPKLLLVTATLSSSILFSVLAVVPSARLVRDGEMVILAIIDISSFAIGAAGALALAMKGFGVWSLVAQIVLISLFRAILTNIRSPTRLRAKLSLSSLRPHVALGGAVGVARLSDFGGRMGEMYVVNGVDGGSLNGPFGFGNQVGKFACEIVNNQIWSLMYVITLNSGKDILRTHYFRLTRLVAILVLPIAAITSASAKELIVLTMGPQWGPSAEFIAYYTPAFAIVCTASIGSAFMYARGEARSPLILNLQLVLLRFAAVCTLPLFGWRPMIYLLSLGHVLNAISVFWFIERRYNWNIKEIVLWLFKPVLAASFCWISMVYLLRRISPSLEGVSLSCLVGLSVYVALMLAMDFKRILIDVKDLHAILRNRKLSHPEVAQ